MADVYWHQGVISSTQFDESYFSRENGKAETEYVFLEANNLPTRFQNNQNITVAELGFGTGLNFLCTWESFLAKNNKNHLQYVSFEKYPLPTDIMQEALSRWPELENLKAQLVEQFPLKEGWNTFEFDRVSLLLGIGDARELLPEWDGQADAWYLDGFSPVKNPELWEEQLMRDVYQHTKPEGTLATYSAAGVVRENLKTAGFMVEKQKGFSLKRHMVTGYRPAES